MTFEPTDKAENPSEQEWFFTFGFGHCDPVSGESLAKCYVRITGSFELARQHMYNAYGNKWAFQYASAEKAGVERYQLREIALRTPPYPWCAGYPTIADCVRAGYCRRDPNCGE
jgi:hypothetical protein